MGNTNEKAGHVDPPIVRTLGFYTDGASGLGVPFHVDTADLMLDREANTATDAVVMSATSSIRFISAPPMVLFD